VHESVFTWRTELYPEGKWLFDWPYIESVFEGEGDARYGTWKRWEEEGDGGEGGSKGEEVSASASASATDSD